MWCTACSSDWRSFALCGGGVCTPGRPGSPFAQIKEYHSRFKFQIAALKPHDETAGLTRVATCLLSVEKKRYPSADHPPDRRRKGEAGLRPLSFSQTGPRCPLLGSPFAVAFSSVEGQPACQKQQQVDRCMPEEYLNNFLNRDSVGIGQ